MKQIIAYLALFIGFTNIAWSQEKGFPQNWVGNWKGELKWYKGATKEPRKIVMELRIHPSDSINKYSWEIIYGSEGRTIVFIH